MGRSNPQGVVCGFLVQKGKCMFAYNTFFFDIFAIHLGSLWVVNLTLTLSGGSGGGNFLDKAKGLSGVSPRGGSREGEAEPPPPDAGIFKLFFKKSMKNFNFW